MSSRLLARWGWCLLLLWLVGYPLAVTIGEALRTEAGGPTFAALLGGRGDLALALARSVWISAATVALAAAIGVPLAFLFARTEFPGRRVLGELVALPVALPPLVGVLAFLYLFGESGFVARAVMAVGGLEAAPWRLAGPGAILLVHAYSMYVYFYLMTRAALAAEDDALREAAAALGAGRLRRLLRVELPLLRPALASAAVLTFLAALGSFSAPYLFGGTFRVMPTQILASKQNGDLDLAEAETALLVLVAIVGLVLSRRLEGRARLATRQRGAAPRRRSFARRGARVAAAVAGWGLALALLAPHATLVLLSFVPRGSWTTEIFPPLLSGANYRDLVSRPEALRPIANSLWMASTATVAALAVGFGAAIAARPVGREAPQSAERARGGRDRSWSGGAIETLLAVPWAVPATALALALAITFGVDRPWAGRFVLVGTLAILPLAYFVRALPTTGQAALAGLARLDPGLDEAAASLGAGRLRRLRRVTLPLLAPTLAAGATLAFLGAFGDFVLSIVLYTYETRPISIEILSALRLQETGLAAAYGVVLTALSAAAFLVWGRERGV